MQVEIGEPQTEMPFCIGAGEAHGALIGKARLKEMPEVVFGRSVCIRVAEIIDSGAAVEPCPPAIVRSGQRCLGAGGFYARYSLSVGVLIVPLVDHGV